MRGLLAVGWRHIVNFGNSSTREASYKYAGCEGDETVFTDAADNQQQTFHMEIKKALWSIPRIPF